MPRTILIVEDTEYCAAMLEVALLTMPDLQVAIASSAEAALKLLETDGERIAALVTDLNMPKMDGFDLIAKVRSLSFPKHFPILVISGDTDLKTPERLRLLGVDAYLPKPYSPAEVRQTLERLLNE